MLPVLSSGRYDILHLKLYIFLGSLGYKFSGVARDFIELATIKIFLPVARAC